jgi:endonuclease YncB( thermonuclease family)
MLKILKRATLPLLLLVASLHSHAGEIFEGQVVGVHDGDTVTVLLAGNHQLKVRLAQIDAPESSQAFGQRSKQSLSDMVFNKTVKIEKETIDKYGRTVGTILADGLDANREQVKRGMAWAYRKYLHDQTLFQDEEAARDAKIGLWADPNPMPPWEYRHGGAQGARTEPAAPLPQTARNMNSTPAPPSSGACGGKTTCKQMASCEEARMYLTQCGLSRLDGDGDGIPCESLCR